jgi:hypothetical protein
LLLIHGGAGSARSKEKTAALLHDSLAEILTDAYAILASGAENKYAERLYKRESP